MIEQRTEAWHKQRLGMMTGSRVGAILGLCPFNKPDDVMRSMVRAHHGAPSEFTGNVATKWGEFNEQNALFDLSLECDIYFRECGFFVRPDARWLGASPDGISDDYILEIKCPFSKREGGEFVSIFNQLHYYAQVQFEMYCAGKSKAVFFQWSPFNSRIEVVDWESDFIEEALPEVPRFHGVYLEELKNREHLEPKRKPVDYDTGPYLAAKMELERATLAFESEKEKLLEVAKASGSQMVDFGMVSASLVNRKGAVDYKKIPQLKGVDLERYRKKPSSHWAIR